MFEIFKISSIFHLSEIYKAAGRIRQMYIELVFLDVKCNDKFKPSNHVDCNVKLYDNFGCEIL